MFFCCITTTTRSMVSNQILGVPWPKKVLDVLENDKKSDFPGNIPGKVQLEKKFGGGGGGGHDFLVRPIYGTGVMGGGGLKSMVATLHKVVNY